MRRSAQQGAPVAGVAPASRPLADGGARGEEILDATPPRGWIDAGGEKGGAERGVSLQLLYEWPVAELDYRKSYQAIQRFGGPSTEGKGRARGDQQGTQPRIASLDDVADHLREV
jgi:hypothetical protein